MKASADRLIEVFNEAKARPAGAERDHFLSEACQDDPELKEQVLSLLQAHEGAGDFLKNTIPPPTVVLTEKPGDKIGRYKLLQKIGEGGCGVVYMAEQEEPVRRRVAFKVIKLGMDTKQVVACFEAEGQALAMMDHPNIAKVFDAGATNTGRPYFVMELVRGIKITEYCDQNNLPTEERLKLFTQVCHAIQHAHQKGIIHRDIKPSNILVTLNDGVPVPKVIDFGIAKAIEQRLTDKTVFTAFEQFIGTPAYMSPEQAEMTSLDIDTRADIYSLGVLLYELLSGNTPFDAQKLVAFGVAEIRRTIREQEPPKPSTRLNTLNRADLGTVAAHRHTDAPKLMHLIRGDLDWIVMKCLEKDRTRRYETANGLAMDLQRHLDNEPVVARPPTNLYRFQKLVRRNKLAFAASAAVLLVLLGGIAASTWQAVRATRAEREQTRLREQAENARNNEARERAKAEANEKRAASEAAKSQQVAQFLKDMLEGVQPSVALGRDTTMLREIVDRTAERVGNGLKGQPEVEAELRSIMGATYLRLSEVPKAEAMHREALRFRRAVFGETNELVVTSLNDLARVLVNADRASEAETLAISAVALGRKLPGNNKWLIGDSLSLLACALQRERKWVEAERFHRETLEIRRQLGDREGVVSTLNNLCLVLRDREQKAEAEEMIREALVLARQIFGPEHPDVATTLKNLAVVLRDQGKLDEAAKTAREALAISTKVAGVSHPETVGMAGTLAGILRRQGKLEEVEVVYREFVASIEQSHRPSVPAIGGLLIEWGKLLRERGKPAEAERVLRQALVAQKSLYGPEHLQVASGLYFLAAASSDQEKWDQAESLHREELAMRRKLLGNDDRTVGKALNDLSAVLLKEGKLAEAETLLRESLAIRQKQLGNNHPDVINSFNLLADLLRAQGKPAETLK